LNGGFFRLDISKHSRLVRERLKGQEVTLGVRPENIHVLEKPRENSIEAKIMVAERLGAKVILDMGITGTDLFKAVAPPEQSVKPGEVKWLEFDLEKIHIIDRGTQQVLA